MPAYSFMSERPPVIGIRIPEWATFTRDIHAGIGDYMRAHRRWRIETRLQTTNEIPAVRIDEDWEGDGLIVFRYTPEEAESWLRRGIRVVNFSSECLDARIPTVTPDNHECGRLAARHLMESGLRHFAFWEDPDRVYSRERLAGFSTELASHGFTCLRFGTVVHSMDDIWKADRIAAVMDRELTRLPGPVGIFAKDDIAAMHVVRGCRRLGLAVPNRVAVVGCNDDFIICHTADIPITSVRYPGRLMGYRIAERLEALLAGGGPEPERTLVPVSGLSVRESTAVMLHAHPHVREALAIIRDLAPRSALHVAEVLERIPCSKAALQRRFLDETGETMKATIDRVRGDKVRDLLVRTPLPIKVIADELGFESQEELSRFFRRHAGVSPSEFRQRHRAGAETFLSDED